MGVEVRAFKSGRSWSKGACAELEAPQRTRHDSRGQKVL